MSLSNSKSFLLVFPPTTVRFVVVLSQELNRWYFCLLTKSLFPLHRSGQSQQWVFRCQEDLLQRTFQLCVSYWTESFRNEIFKTRTSMFDSSIFPLFYRKIDCKVQIFNWEADLGLIGQAEYVYPLTSAWYPLGKYPLIMQFIDDVLTSYLDNSNPSYINYFLDQALKVCIQNDDEEKMNSLLDQFNDTFNDAETVFTWIYCRLWFRLSTTRSCCRWRKDNSIPLCRLWNLSFLHWGIFCWSWIIFSNDSLRLSCANNYCICCLHCCQVDAAISKLEVFSWFSHVLQSK